MRKKGKKRIFVQKSYLKHVICLPFTFFLLFFVEKVRNGSKRKERRRGKGKEKRKRKRKKEKGKGERRLTFTSPVA